jgi:hypothetical protein
MTEIKKTDMSTNVNFRANEVNSISVAKSKNEETKEETVLKDTDLRHDPIAYLGRSQVKKSDSKSIDNDLRTNLEKDLEFLDKNPEFVEKANAVFESAYANAIETSQEKPYKHASNIQDAFINEFSQNSNTL